MKKFQSYLGCMRASTRFAMTFLTQRQREDMHAMLTIIVKAVEEIFFSKNGLLIKLTCLFLTSLAQ